jgi:hypothetical protein
VLLLRADPNAPPGEERRGDEVGEVEANTGGK